MGKPVGIIVFGTNGSGKTTIGRELAHILSFKHMDIEDYCFETSVIPYTSLRPHEDVVRLMLADIATHRSFVMSAVTGDYGAEISSLYKLAVYITAPLDLRIERIRKRTFELHGDRVLKGGDMYKQEQDFLDFVTSRSSLEIDKWAKMLTCPIIHVDGAEDWRMNAASIAKQFKELWSRNPTVTGC